jgi:two-component SAPR family response regulator
VLISVNNYQLHDFRHPPIAGYTAVEADNAQGERVPRRAIRSSSTLIASAEARAWLEANTADIAIVDFMLKDGPATELAGELNRRAIPFVIYSGYPPRQSLAPELPGVPWLEKPTSRDRLLKAVLKTLMAVSGQAPSTPGRH